MIGILFDLDGTLLDTLEDLTNAVNHALALHGLPARTLSEIREFVGSGAALLIRRATGDAPFWETVLADFRTYYDAHCRVKTGPYEGIMETLAGLRRKYPVAVVSNKPDSAVKLLCREYFPGLIAIGEHPGCPRKPAPDMLQLAMAQLGVERCVYVGDSEVDVRTAKNAGVPCISVLWGFRDRPALEEAGAEHFCQTPAELYGVIEKLSIGEYHGK